jgi:hypothetical protein
MSAPEPQYIALAFIGERWHWDVCFTDAALDQAGDDETLPDSFWSILRMLEAKELQWETRE